MKKTELLKESNRCQDCGEKLPTKADRFFTQCERCLRHVEHS
ncbi:hypothetical protein [Geomicrobium sediminis]|uniref:Ribosomal protein S14 n=1 Tax=Geomicrobium sediminis TaxID=1347788 RepID=A0ABS2PIY3_9BACL|nr:hypothetical protein [Geomicrobium sediminis]MBM7634783.1 ribosomal protein S14 [Geomicrobium sediminis]